MKIAIVHDYIREFGGAERVLKTLHEMYPEAPIYTSFADKNSTAYKELIGAKIKESFLAPLLKCGKLYSPLRFLIPIVWGSMDLSNYDLVITSSSWYVTRGFKVGQKTRVVCYCHTPPRWLYGYDTSINIQKYLPVKIYSAIVGHIIRIYDFYTAQKISNWIANSENVKKRIEKFYRKDAVVIYPPVDVKNITNTTSILYGNEVKNKAKTNYFLIVSRLVGAKGLEEAARAFKNSNYNLKIVGEAHGFSDVEKRLKKLSGGNIELVGRASDRELYRLYKGSLGFIALARDEDFGMTVVEAQAAGIPVIAFNGGGFKESVIDGVTGILINDTDVETIKSAVHKIVNTKWNKNEIVKNSMRFSKENFIKKFRSYISSLA